MFFHAASLQFESKPDKPDPVYALHGRSDAAGGRHVGDRTQRG